MAVHKLVLFPSEILARPADPIREFGPSLETLLNDLWDTLAATPGVGLAAPQIGVSKRVSVIDVGRGKRKSKGVSAPIELINPKIIEAHGEQIPREGCLSVPDLLANVKRFLSVSVRTLDRAGRVRTLTAEGFEALALQHEIDHLDGKLFLDRVSSLKTDVFRRSAY